ncbi:MAG: DUF2793 domain-containing protein [Planctomycetes bacterium]|nr:DUF2793 domain-containing protein [Planctomycetota bacterium]
MSEVPIVPEALTVSPKLGLSLIFQGQQNAEVQFNELLLFMDAAGPFLEFEDHVNDPPAGLDATNNGELYIITDSPTGIFVGHNVELALWINPAWKFIKVGRGCIGWLKTDTAGGLLTEGSGAAMTVIFLGGVLWRGGVFKSPATGVAAFTDSSGGTPGQTIGAVSGSGDDAQINDNFASLTDDINKIITALRERYIAIP